MEYKIKIEKIIYGFYPFGKAFVATYNMIR